jgi:hypothetical protein
MTAMVEYALVMISFLVEARGLSRDDLDAELVADAMMRGAADVPQLQCHWAACYAAAETALLAT